MSVSLCVLYVYIIYIYIYHLYQIIYIISYYGVKHCKASGRQTKRELATWPWYTTQNEMSSNVRNTRLPNPHTTMLAGVWAMRKRLHQWPVVCKSTRTQWIGWAKHARGIECNEYLLARERMTSTWYTKIHSRLGFSRNNRSYPIMTYHGWCFWEIWITLALFATLDTKNPRWNVGALSTCRRRACGRSCSWHTRLLPESLKSLD